MSKYTKYFLSDSLDRLILNQLKNILRHSEFRGPRTLVRTGVILDEIFGLKFRIFLFEFLKELFIVMDDTGRVSHVI